MRSSPALRPDWINRPTRSEAFDPTRDNDANQIREPNMRDGGPRLTDTLGEKPHYLGHRQRLRDRFLTGGPAALADYELLELLLYQAQPRGDVKPLAKTLIKRFGSFAGVLAAAPGELGEVKGVKDASVVALKAVEADALLMARQALINRPVIGAWKKRRDLCHAAD